MSLSININKLDDKQRAKILKDLTFLKENEQEFYAFNIDDGTEELVVPYYYGRKDIKIKVPKKDYSKTSVVFKGELRDTQKDVRKEIITDLNNHGTSVLSLQTGGGKTITSINISTKIRLKTLVVVNRVLLLDQWKASIEKFSDGKCQIIKPGKKIDRNLDYYIINGQNIGKIDPDFLNTIGFVIIDELHLLMTETIIKNLLYLRPKYFLGLSATPYRTDSFNDVINRFFGKNRVIRKLNKEHTVYRINTKFVPDVEKDYRGKIIWNSVLNSQAYSIERNQIIIDLIVKFNDRNVLVLVKRLDHGKYLLKELEKIGIEADSLLGKQKYKETTNRVLIGTVSKTGTGFDCPKLDTLIVAADLAAYFIQSLGRVFRRQDSNPIIFDLVDDNSVLKAHWAERRKVYIEAGGIVKYVKDVEKLII